MITYLWFRVKLLFANRKSAMRMVREHNPRWREAMDDLVGEMKTLPATKQVYEAMEHLRKADEAWLELLASAEAELKKEMSSETGR